MAQAIESDVEKVAESLKEAEEKYCFFWKKDSPYSQFYSCIFEVDGQRYCCAEQYMMHQKACKFTVFSCLVIQLAEAHTSQHANG